MAAEKTIQTQYAKGPIDVVKQFWLFIVLSLIVTVPGVIVMGMSMSSYPNHSPLRLGIDFTGGTLIQYGFVKTLDQEKDLPQMRELIEKMGISNPIIQLQQAEKGMKGVTSAITTEQFKDQEADALKKKTEAAAKAPEGKNQTITQMFNDGDQTKKPATDEAKALSSIVSIRVQDLSTEKTIALQKTLKDNFGEFALLQKNRVGPTLAKELFIKAAWGLVLAYALIVGYMSIRFKLDYALAAIVALLHDTIFMLGAFSILGWYFHIEVDSMFVTAILTVVGFSVHDTIVVFDRIRENARVLNTKKLPFSDIVNISVNQTLARSINTSLTALLTLTALYFLGGESTRHFVLAMILGIMTGTYSSIFVASSLLAWWRGKNTSKQSSASSSHPIAV